ncbi:MAG: hypothetical protein ABH879_08650 [archaeon]
MDCLEITVEAYHKMLGIAGAVSELAGTDVECVGLLLGNDHVLDVALIPEQEVTHFSSTFSFAESVGRYTDLGYQVLGMFHSHGRHNVGHDTADLKSLEDLCHAKRFVRRIRGLPHEIGATVSVVVNRNTRDDSHNYHAVQLSGFPDNPAWNEAKISLINESNNIRTGDDYLRSLCAGCIKYSSNYLVQHTPDDTSLEMRSLLRTMGQYNRLVCRIMNQARARPGEADIYPVLYGLQLVQSIYSTCLSARYHPQYRKILNLNAIQMRYILHAGTMQYIYMRRRSKSVFQRLFDRICRYF